MYSPYEYSITFSNVDISSFVSSKCWISHEDGFRHILRVQELADWIHIHPEIFGHRNLYEQKGSKK